MCHCSQAAASIWHCTVLEFAWRCYGIVSSTFEIVQILVQTHFDLVSLVLALEATEPVSEPVTQMAVELINNQLPHFSIAKECKSYIIFHVKTSTNKFWNDAEMLLKWFENQDFKMLT